MMSELILPERREQIRTVVACIADAPVDRPNDHAGAGIRLEHGLEFGVLDRDFAEPAGPIVL